MTMFHRDASTGDVHQIHQWTYADATAKAAATGFASSDVGKVALQIDTAAYYILTATTPTWQKIGEVGATDTLTLTNKKLSDSTTMIVDVSDATKVIAFDAGGTTGTKTTIAGAQTANRVVTLPDATTTLVGTDTTQTLANKTLTDSSTVISDASDATKQIKFDAGGTTSTATTLTAAQTANRTVTLPDATTTLVGTGVTQTLSNKTVSDPVTFTEITTPSTPGASLRKFYPKADGKFYHVGSDGLEKAVGSGAGGLNLLTLGSTYSIDNADDADLEGSVGRWAVYADAAATTPVDMTGGSPGTTVARTTSTPLNGAGSLLMDLGSGSSRQGEGSVLGPVYIPPGYRGRTVQMTAVFAATGAIVDGDVVPYVYDITNSALIAPYVFGKILGSSGKLGFRFDVPSTCATLRVGFHVARTTTAALSIKFDDLKLTDEVVPIGLAGSNGASYTPTFSAGFGTVTGINAVWYRVGRNIFIEATWSNGTIAASAPTVSLPPGLAVASTVPALSIRGHAWTQTASGTGYLNVGQIIVAPGDTTMSFTTNASATLAKHTNATNIFSNSSVSSIIVGPIPIEGWDANVTMAQSSTFKISSYLANGARVTATPTRLGEYRSQLRNASARTWTDTNGTPTATPSSADGIRIYCGNAYSSADTNNQPSRYDIFIGKEKNYRIDWYASAGRTGFVDTRPGIFTAVGSSSTGYDLGWATTYDPATGVLTLIRPTMHGSDSLGHKAIQSDGDYATLSPYFDITVSENALAVGTSNPRSQASVTGVTGYGSSSTVMIRFTNLTVNTGIAITYTNSSTLGSLWTINEDGIYSLNVGIRESSGGNYLGIFRGATGAALTTDPSSTALSTTGDAGVIAFGCTTAAQPSPVSTTVFLRAGDVITFGVKAGLTFSTSWATVTKVSN